jgi:hypothetical protein
VLAVIADAIRAACAAGLIVELRPYSGPGVDSAVVVDVSRELPTDDRLSWSMSVRLDGTYDDAGALAYAVRAGTKFLTQEPAR